MRARNIKPGFFKNETLADLSAVTRLLFIGLWMEADREGRLEDRPRRIAADVFPYERDLDIDASLTALEEGGFIIRCRVGQLRLTQVLNFKKHQSPHHTEKQSVLPAPVAYGEPTATSRCSNGGNPPDSLNPDSLTQNPLSEHCCSDQASSPVPRKATKEPSQDAWRLAAKLKAEILRNIPDFRITPAQERNWAIAAQRMIEIDKRDPGEIAEVIEWAQRDEFWMSNILSMEKVRKQFDVLQLKRRRVTGPTHAPTFEEIEACSQAEVVSL